MSSTPTRRRLVVFSHPNHELAIFGFIKRMRPYLLFLSDGGGPTRVDETRRGLAAIGVEDRAHFLDVPEAAYYTALLDHDVRFCRRVAAEIRACAEKVQPDALLCDAVELYNPVHDLSLPLVLHTQPRAAIFTVPLVYQSAGADEAYEVQRLPPNEQGEQESFALTDDEIDTKFHARDHIYHQLRQQLGGILNISREHARHEVFHRGTRLRSEPDRERRMRYEWRGRLLQQNGTVDDVITYADHYRPLVASL